MLNFRGKYHSFWPDLIRSGCAEDGGGETLLAPVKLDNAASWNAEQRNHFCLKEKLHLSTINDKGISQFFEGARNMFFFFLVVNVYILVSLLSQLTSLLLGLTCTILWVKSSKIWVMGILGVYMYPVSQRPLR